jgi:methionine-rich copper-binding protein CopC
MRPVVSLVIAAAGVAAASSALAHAFLESASPRPGAKVTAPPSEVRIVFSEPVEAAFSSISVSGPPGFAGAALAKPVTTQGRTLAARMPGSLPAGRYVVRWRVISIDSHTTQGSFAFEVGR